MKKYLILCLVLAVIFAGAGFYFDQRDKRENAKARELDKEFFQRIEQEEYDHALAYINSNKGLVDKETIAKIEFIRATILYREAEAVYVEYAQAINDPRVTNLPDITEALELYKKPLEILNKLQQDKNAKNWDWGWRIYNDKVDSLVYQIYIYLYLISQLKEEDTRENKEKIEKYNKLVREDLYVQALETAKTAVELVKGKDRKGEIIAIQNLEFLTREPTQQAFQQEQGKGKQGQEQGQRGLGHLAKQRGQQGQGQKVKILPLPLQKGKKGKGAGAAKVKKGKK